MYPCLCVCVRTQQVRESHCIENGLRSDDDAVVALCGKMATSALSGFILEEEPTEQGQRNDDTIVHDQQQPLAHSQTTADTIQRALERRGGGGLLGDVERIVGCKAERSIAFRGMWCAHALLLHPSRQFAHIPMIVVRPLRHSASPRATAT
jgi:hypothetical protein